MLSNVGTVQPKTNIYYSFEVRWSKMISFHSGRARSKKLANLIEPECSRSLSSLTLLSAVRFFLLPAVVIAPVPPLASEPLFRPWPLSPCAAPPSLCRRSAWRAPHNRACAALHGLRAQADLRQPLIKPPAPIRLIVMCIHCLRWLECLINIYCLIALY
jgi:hypothetical protein